MQFQDRFVSKFPNPLEVDAIFVALAKEYTDLCRLEQLPYLSHGYYGQRVEAHGRHPMSVLCITSPEGPVEKPAVLIMRSHHAREWINAIAVVETARQLLENYRPDDTDPRVRRVVSILDNTVVMIIPEGNPDGARLSFFDAGHRMWRKNLRPTGDSNCPGVDCNRNYPHYWGDPGSSAQPCTETYRGSAALSEPESANIAQFTELYRNIIFAIDSHSHGQAIFRPTKSGGPFIPTLPVTEEDELIYENLEAAMNRGICLIQGIYYSTGTTSNHAGTTDEFFFFERQIFGFNLECGHRFQPSFDEAHLAALEVTEAVKALAWCATGQTGLDIPALLARRREVAPDESITAIQPVPSAEPWQVSPQRAEQWRRFVVECKAMKLAEVSREILALQDQGFDIIGQTKDKLEIVASVEELTKLLESGYQPQIVRDLSLENGWHE